MRIMFEIKHRFIHHASHYKSNIDKSIENKFASRTYDFADNFRIRMIYLPRTSLLPTVCVATNIDTNGVWKKIRIGALPEI